MLRNMEHQNIPKPNILVDSSSEGEDARVQCSDVMGKNSKTQKLYKEQ